MGRVGKHHKQMAFNPRNQRSWSGQRGRALRVIYDADPVRLVCREVADKIGVAPNQTATRLQELREDYGLIEWPGDKHDTATGNPAFEITITPAGRDWVRAGLGLGPPPLPTPKKRRRLVKVP